MPHTQPGSGIGFNLFTFVVGCGFSLAKMAGGAFSTINLAHSLEVVYYAALGGLVSVAVKGVVELATRRIKKALK